MRGEWISRFQEPDRPSRRQDAVGRSAASRLGWSLGNGPVLSAGGRTHGGGPPRHRSDQRGQAPDRPVPARFRDVPTRPSRRIRQGCLTRLPAAIVFSVDALASVSGSAELSRNSIDCENAGLMKKSSILHQAMCFQTCGHPNSVRVSLTNGANR